MPLHQIFPGYYPQNLPIIIPELLPECLKSNLLDLTPSCNNYSFLEVPAKTYQQSLVNSSSHKLIKFNIGKESKIKQVTVSYDADIIKEIEAAAFDDATFGSEVVSNLASDSGDTTSLDSAAIINSTYDSNGMSDKNVALTNNIILALKEINTRNPEFTKGNLGIEINTTLKIVNFDTGKTEKVNVPIITTYAAPNKKCSTKSEFEQVLDKHCKNIDDHSKKLSGGALIVGSSIEALKSTTSENDLLTTCEIETYTGRKEILIPQSLKKQLNNTERLWQQSFYVDVLKSVGENHYRPGLELVNALTQRQDNEKINYRTIQKNVVKEGEKIDRDIIVEANNILDLNGFDPESGKVKDESKIPGSVKNPIVNNDRTRDVYELLVKRIEKYNENKKLEAQIPKTLDDKTDISHPKDTTIVSIDIVETKEQKENRVDENNVEQQTNLELTNQTDQKTKRKTIPSVVSTITTYEGSIAITTGNIKDAVRITLAILLKTHAIENKKLIFFTDGQKEINKAIEEIFKFREFKIYLDWYHLHKKCYEYMTMLLKGGKRNFERNQKIRHGLYERLFVGNIEGAIDYLMDINAAYLKDYEIIEEIIKYLNKRKQYIYCYACRKILLLINSSNRVEKANDRIVSCRCKNSSMSWSDPGLRGIRNLRCLMFNREIEYLKTRRINFNLKKHENNYLKKMEWLDRKICELKAA